MPHKLSKADRAALFRDRLTTAMATAGISRAALARAVGVDRSTLSQALSDTGARMPGAHLVAGAAAALGVSSDWLLGLSNRPESAADLVAAALEVSQAPRALVDQTIFDWHREAAGYKIRHVPAALPDMLKTDAMLEWEYGPHLGRSAQQAINASRDRLDWMRESHSDYEIAMPIYEMESFIRGTGYYTGLPAPVRLAQADHMEMLTRQLYPRLRIYLFDARRLYSAPVTVFGTLLAVFYTGGHYMAFRDRQRIETFTQDFDVLVREASHTARDLPGMIREMRALIR